MERLRHSKERVSIPKVLVRGAGLSSHPRAPGDEGHACCREVAIKHLHVDHTVDVESPGLLERMQDLAFQLLDQPDADGLSSCVVEREGRSFSGSPPIGMALQKGARPPRPAPQLVRDKPPAPSLRSRR